MKSLLNLVLTGNQINQCQSIIEAEQKVESIHLLNQSSTKPSFFTSSQNPVVGARDYA